MSHEEELRQAEEVAIGIARSLDENEYEQVQNPYEAIEADPDGLSQEQMIVLGQISGLAQLIKGAIERFAYDGGFRRTYILDTESFTRQMREEFLPPLASIENEKVREHWEVAERWCQKAERAIASVDPKFITDRRGRKKNESSLQTRLFYWEVIQMECFKAFHLQ